MYSRAKPRGFDKAREENSSKNIDAMAAVLLRSNGMQPSTLDHIQSECAVGLERDDTCRPILLLLVVVRPSASDGVHVVPDYVVDTAGARHNRSVTPWSEDTSFGSPLVGKGQAVYCSAPNLPCCTLWLVKPLVHLLFPSLRW